MGNSTTKYPMSPRKRWAPEERATLRELVREDLPTAAIARQIHNRCQRSAKAALHQIDRSPELRALRGSRLLRKHSQREIAALFGADSKLVRTWIERGWLAANRYRNPRKRERDRSGPMVLICDAAVVAFLVVEEAWPSYEPARIVDPDLRAEAGRLRAEAGGGWVKGADLMRKLCYCAKHVARMVAAYPGPKRMTTWQSAIYLWTPDVPAFVAWVREPNRRRAA